MAMQVKFMGVAISDSVSVMLAGALIIIGALAGWLATEEC